MTEKVLVSIRGLHSAPDAPDEDIEVIFPGTCRKVGDTWYVRYSEPVDGYQEGVANLIKMRPGSLELTKKGVMNTHMVFEKGKKNDTVYETPVGYLTLGITGIDVAMDEYENRLEARADYALDVNDQLHTDCALTICVTSQGQKVHLEDGLQ